MPAVEKHLDRPRMLLHIGQRAHVIRERRIGAPGHDLQECVERAVHVYRLRLRKHAAADLGLDRGELDGDLRTRACSRRLSPGRRSRSRSSGEFGGTMTTSPVASNGLQKSTTIARAGVSAICATMMSILPASSAGMSAGNSTSTNVHFTFSVAHIVRAKFDLEALRISARVAVHDGRVFELDPDPQFLPVEDLIHQRLRCAGLGRCLATPRPWLRRPSTAVRRGQTLFFGSLLSSLSFICFGRSLARPGTPGPGRHPIILARNCVL